MIPAVGVQPVKNNQNKGYYVDPEVMKEILDSHDHLVPSNPINQVNVFKNKMLDAVIHYPAKGLTGSKNSNFYEFLTMGMVPYTIGSLTLIAMFNSCNKLFSPFDAAKAQKIGNKMALGVILYGLMKFVSKKFIEIPVYLKTGVDMNQLYRTTKDQLPEVAGEEPLQPVHEYHKVFESVDFPRWDLLYEKEDKPRNYYYDKVAKKMGLGKNLVDSDQEVKPEVKSMIIRARTAATLSSYAWAGLGVALAAQDAWLDKLAKPDSNGFSACRASVPFWKKEYYTELPTRAKIFYGILKEKFFTKEFRKNLCEAAKESFKSLYNGGETPTKAKIIMGRGLVWAAAGSTVLGALNAMFNFHGKKQTFDEAKIDYNKNYTVD